MGVHARTLLTPQHQGRRRRAHSIISMTFDTNTRIIFSYAKPALNAAGRRNVRKRTPRTRIQGPLAPSLSLARRKLLVLHKPPSSGCTLVAFRKLLALVLLRTVLPEPVACACRHAPSGSAYFRYAFGSFSTGGASSKGSTEIGEFSGFELRRRVDRMALTFTVGPLGSFGRVVSALIHAMYMPINVTPSATPDNEVPAS